MTDQPKSWRDQIKVHPAADLFPMMTVDELKALGEDIRENGLQTNIAVWRASDGHPWSLIDGRNRLDAAEAVGLPVKFIKKSGQVTVKIGDYMNAVDDMGSMTDPYAFVISANVHRRHLTAEQKRDVIAAVLKAQPEKSNRTIAKQTKTDHKTVGAVRDKLEAGGEIPHHDVHQDARGTMQPAQKPPTAKRGQADGEFPVHFGSCHGGRVVTERTNTAQAKLDAAIRQYQRKLDADLAEQRAQLVTEFDLERIDWLRRLNERQAEYDAVISARKGVMTRKTFDAIRRCLHPDSRQSVSDERLAEAFRLFGKLELKLLPESDFPTRRFKPINPADLLEAKVRADEARRAKRVAKREANLAHRPPTTP